MPCVFNKSVVFFRYLGVYRTHGRFQFDVDSRQRVGSQRTVGSKNRHKQQRQQFLKISRKRRGQARHIRMQTIQNNPSGESETKRTEQADTSVQVKREPAVVPPDRMKHTLRCIRGNIFQYGRTKHTRKKNVPGIRQPAAEQNVQYRANAINRTIRACQHTAIVPFQLFDTAIDRFVNPSQDTI